MTAVAGWPLGTAGAAEAEATAAAFDDFTRVTARHLAELSSQLATVHAQLAGARERDLVAAVQALRRENEELRRASDKRKPKGSQAAGAPTTALQAHALPPAELLAAVPIDDILSERGPARPPAHPGRELLSTFVVNNMEEPPRTGGGGAEECSWLRALEPLDACTSLPHTPHGSPAQRVVVALGSPVQRSGGLLGGGFLTAENSAKKPPSSVSICDQLGTPKSLALGSPIGRIQTGFFGLGCGLSPDKAGFCKSSPARCFSSAGSSPFRSPDRVWSSPLRRRGTGCFQLWPELMVDPGEAHHGQAIEWDEENPELCLEEKKVDAKLARQASFQSDIGEDVKCDAQRCIASPSGWPRMIWMIGGMPVLGYDLITIPMEVFPMPAYLIDDIMSWITRLYWSCDLVASFFVGYYTDDGRLVKEPRLIAKRYLKSSFALDLLIVGSDWFLVGIEGVGSNEASDAVGGVRLGKLFRFLRILRVLRLVRLRKLRNIFRAIQERVDSEYFAVVVNILKNLLCIIAASHAVACLWFWVGTRKVEGYASWVSFYHLESTDWDYMYWTSLHWVITQFTPGSMHVQPQNVPERIFSVVMLLCALMVFSIFVSSLTNAMAQLQSLGSKSASQFWVLQRFFRQNSISRDLTLRVNRYVNLVLMPQQGRVQYKDVGVLDSLPSALQVELQTELNMPYLVVHPFFEQFGRRSLDVMRRLCCTAVKPASLSRGDVLFCVGQKASCMYFLVEGRLAYAPKKSESAEAITKGQWFCEAVLWCPWVHRGKMQAQTECELITLDAAKFRAVVMDYHVDLRFLQLYAGAFVLGLNESTSVSVASGVGTGSAGPSDLLAEKLAEGCVEAALQRASF
jgi:hypothetical protein